MERKRLVERMEKLDKQYSKVLPGEGCRAGGLLRSDSRKNRQEKVNGKRETKPALGVNT